MEQAVRFLRNFDRFSLILILTVIVAFVLPADGHAAAALDVVTDAGIALLFFMHGAKLSRAEMAAGAGNWRLHLLIVASTFVLFPVLIQPMRLIPEALLPRDLLIGFLFLACLPSTVQSSIAFTSIARGNVPGAVYASSLSNLLGVFITPVLVGLLIQMEGEIPLVESVMKIVLQILLPFVVGHLLRPWIGAWIVRNKAWIGTVDRGTILLIVYAAISESVVDGVWSSVPPAAIAVTFALSIALLALVLFATAHAARAVGLSLDDEITAVFCGSKKSLASGMPMAKVLFEGSPHLGLFVLPLILFHEIQLIVCAVLARKYADSPRRATLTGDASATGVASS